MKKFLIFLVSLVVVVCVGLTTYYFMRNNEIITIQTKEIYCNAGDTIPLNSLGISIKKANISKITTFDYNAGGDNVTKYIKYDEASNSFIVSQENAGDVTLVIRTSNKKYADFTISVHIGDGSVENPYYIFNESELSRIGSTYRLDKHYRLMNDITLTAGFKPLGYNANTDTWENFNGSFDGQGYSIKGLNLNNLETANAGLFYGLGANSTVKNLTVENATINGSYANAGVLAGVVNGTVEKVVVKNSTINNLASASSTGALAGTYAGKGLKISYADNVSINIGAEDVSVSNAVVGGLVGKVDQSVIQACYTNNINIKITNSTVVSGGFVGEFVIGTNHGSIQQSYSNTTSADANFAAFIGKITKATGFDNANANMLKHLIGNMAVVYGKDSSASITDADLVKVYDNTFFKNTTYVNNSVFFDKGAALYLIRGYAGASDLISTNEFVYYAIDMNTLTTWDTDYVWNVKNNTLPTLRMGNIYPADPSGEYFRRNLAQKDLGNEDTFKDLFTTDVKDESIKILDDMDLTSGWTPVSVVNSTIDGNNKTIRINLNQAVNGNVGLFATIDNSTIKNLNIVVTGFSANATNAGALAGKIISSDSLTSSTIENVTVTFENFGTPTITNFGGIAGTIENTIITNCKIQKLDVNSNAIIYNAGALVAEVKENSQISLSEVSASTIYATSNAAGLVAMNKGSIVSTSADVNVKYSSSVINASVGGVVANNEGTISNVTVNANITLSSVADSQNIGGVVANNNGVINNVTVSGSIVINTTDSKKIYVGGVVANNNGSVEFVNNLMSQVGTYQLGANHYVGGVAAVNNGKIKQVLVSADLAGNYVSGVVAQMHNASATVDQVVVGKYNPATKVFTQNVITGDKYLAGIIVDFKSGTITNVQATSNINGKTNATRSSLVALIFPYGATIKSATINSSLTGYGIFYRETWKDFASYGNKAEFGLSNGSTGDSRFNLYTNNTFHGKMQSVVINSANDGVSSAKAAMGTAFAWSVEYQDSSESSFIKMVNGFNDASQFQGSFTFTCAVSSGFGIKHEATRTLDFAIGSIWKSNNGISLMFVENFEYPVG